jgi:hypothetical protein
MSTIQLIAAIAHNWRLGAMSIRLLAFVLDFHVVSIQASISGIPGGQCSSYLKRRKVHFNRPALVVLTDPGYVYNLCVSSADNPASLTSANGHSISLPTIFVLKPTIIAKAHAFDQLRCDIESFAVDIAVVCESWLKPKHTSDLFTVQDFRLFLCDRIGRVGGGVFVWVRLRFKCEEHLVGRVSLILYLSSYGCLLNTVIQLT